jgi:GT2 family glycosyltransferase
MTAFLPTFSVIIPTYQRPIQLTQCLQALAALEYPLDDFEVIIVDDGSPEPLDQTVQPFRSVLNLRLIRKTNGGPGSARNAGATVACGKFLAFTDDDCRPAPDWLRRLEERLTQNPDHLVGGRTENSLHDNSFALTSQIIVNAAYTYYNRYQNNARFFASNNIAVAADLFQKIGGFDATFRIASEDREFCDRWRCGGLMLSYAPDALVLHAHSLTFRSFCQQHFNYGRGAWRFHCARSLRGFDPLWRKLQLHTGFLSLLRAPLSQLPPRQVITVSILLVLWQVLNALGFLAERFWPIMRAPEELPVADSQEGFDRSL